MNGTVTRTVNRSTNFTLRENLTYKVNDRLSLSADGSFYQKWNYRPHGAFKYYTYDQFYRNFDVAGGAKYALGGLNFLSVDLLMVTIAISIITIIKMSRTSSIRRRVYVFTRYPACFCKRKPAKWVTTIYVSSFGTRGYVSDYTLLLRTNASPLKLQEIASYRKIVHKLLASN